MQQRISRRNFVRLSTLTATGALLAACGPQMTATVAPEAPASEPATKVPPTQPAEMKYSEAPMLAELVKAQKIPPVDQRLPVDLVVVEPYEEPGQYGGTLHVISGDSSGDLKMLIAYDSPIRVNPDYTAYEANLVKSFTPSEDGKTFTIVMRKGIKWSDGEPFTTEDIAFWWQDLCLNEEYEAVRPPWWGNKKGTPMEVEIVDDFTWKIKIAEPDFAMLRNVLGVGFWEWESLMTPKHYLKQFHPKYTPDAKWETFTEKNDYINNPDFPTIFAWHTVEYKPGEKWVLERNPYYWKVDSNGQQLPYIDRIENKIADDGDVRLVQIASGQVDADWRGAYNPRNIALLREKAEAGDYRVLLYSDALLGYPALEVNQNHTQDAYMRELLRTTDFLRALSVSINRERVNDVVWNGLATPMQGATISDPAYQFSDTEGKQILETWTKNYAEFDQEKAKKLLDGLGLDKMDGDGFRTRPDGSKLELIIDVTGWGGADTNTAMSEAVKPMLEAVGLRTILNTTIGTPDETLRWEEGKTQIRTYAMGTFNLWNWPDETFPINADSTWPLVGKWYSSAGDEGEAPASGSVEEKLLAMYAQGVNEADPMRQAAVLHQVAQIWIDQGPFIIGLTGNVPMPVVVKNNLRNVREKGILGPWEVGTPGNLQPEQFFFKM